MKTLLAIVLIGFSFSLMADSVLEDDQLGRITAGGFETIFANNSFFQAMAEARGDATQVYARVGTNFGQASSFASTSSGLSATSFSRSTVSFSR